MAVRRVGGLRGRHRKVHQEADGEKGKGKSRGGGSLCDGVTREEESPTNVWAWEGGTRDWESCLHKKGYEGAGENLIISRPKKKEEGSKRKKKNSCKAKGGKNFKGSRQANNLSGSIAKKRTKYQPREGDSVVYDGREEGGANRGLRKYAARQPGKRFLTMPQVSQQRRGNPIKEEPSLRKKRDQVVHTDRDGKASDR